MGNSHGCKENGDWKHALSLNTASTRENFLESPFDKFNDSFAVVSVIQIKMPTTSLNLYLNPVLYL